MLQTLHEYGQTLGGEPGFKTREVRWQIDITSDGKLIGILPLGDGKKGKSVERCPDMHGMNAGGKAHFLVESAQTVAMHFKTNEDAKRIEGGKIRHQFYVDLLAQAGATILPVKNIHQFLSESDSFEPLQRSMAQLKVKPTDWITWRVGGEDVSSYKPVQDWWRQWRTVDLDASSSPDSSDAATMVCLLTGERIQPLATHPKITGLGGVGGLAMGDVMVGCDKPAFTSFNLEQSANAAMSAEAAQAYVDGLNELIRSHSKRIGTSLVTYWFKERIDPEDDPFSILSGIESDDQKTASALIQARALLASIRSGKRQDLGTNRYYAMTLSGAAGRVMVRDWMEGQFEQLVANIEAWFSDLSIVARDQGTLAPDPKFMAVAGALLRDENKDLKELAPSVASTLWHVALADMPIPQPIMAQALGRFRTSVLTDRSPLHARIGLIKAYFVRKEKGTGQHMKPYLNPDHPDPSYHCGRLLAVLASLQRAALGDVGAGVVQRFYPAASQAPALTLGRLIANARNHLGKLEGGLPWWYEERIAEIMGRMRDQIPRTLNLEEQGLFALGYYQQLADLRSGKKSNQDTADSGDQT